MTAPLPNIERLRETLDYFPDSGELRWKLRLPAKGLNHVRLAGMLIARLHHSGYIIFRLDRRELLAHRAAWAVHFGAWPKGQIDHINGDRADNRLCNLRDATAAENTQNQRVIKGATPFKGVTRNRLRYQAQIKANGKPTYIGIYPTAEDAARAYDAAAIRLHGPFALTNADLGLLPQVPA
jgi:hypothetical protein